MGLTYAAACHQGEIDFRLHLQDSPVVLRVCKQHPLHISAGFTAHHPPQRLTLTLPGIRKRAVLYSKPPFPLRAETPLNSEAHEDKHARNVSSNCCNTCNEQRLHLLKHCVFKPHQKPQVGAEGGAAAGEGQRGAAGTPTPALQRLHEPTPIRA